LLQLSQRVQARTPAWSFRDRADGASAELGDNIGIPFTFTAHGYNVYRIPPPDFADRVAAAAAVITVSRANARHIPLILCITRYEPVKNLGLLLQAVACCGRRNGRSRSEILATAVGAARSIAERENRILTVSSS